MSKKDIIFTLFAKGRILGVRCNYCEKFFNRNNNFTNESFLFWTQNKQNLICFNCKEEKQVNTDQYFNWRIPTQRAFYKSSFCDDKTTQQIIEKFPFFFQNEF